MLCWDLLSLWHTRSLRTQRGETAHSIAAQAGRPEELLNLLALPPDLLQYREEIGRQEEALHNIIRGRSQFLLHRHGLQLPQVWIFPALLLSFANDLTTRGFRSVYYGRLLSSRVGKVGAPSGSPCLACTGASRWSWRSWAGTLWWTGATWPLSL